MPSYQEVSAYLESITGAAVINSTQYPLNTGAQINNFRIQIAPRSAYAQLPEKTLPSLMFSYINHNPNSYGSAYARFEFNLLSDLPLFNGEYTDNGRNLMAQDQYGLAMNIPHNSSRLHLAQEIQLATVFDNNQKLKELLELHVANHPTMPLKELIAKLDLFVLAAGNGAIKVVKDFIAMGLNLEQRATIPDEAAPGTTQGNKKIELTPLAAVVYSIPKLGHEKATGLIDVLLQAGADYNYQAKIKWTEQRGYAGSTTIERDSRTKLFDLDKSGLFGERVEAHRKKSAGKERGPHKSFAAGPSQLPQYSGDSIEHLIGDNKFLKAEVSRLSHTVASLQQAVAQLQAHLGIQAEEQPVVHPVANPRGGYQGRGNYRGNHHPRGGRGGSGGFYDHTRGGAGTHETALSPSTNP